MDTNYLQEDQFRQEPEAFDGAAASDNGDFGTEDSGGVPAGSDVGAVESETRSPDGDEVRDEGGKGINGFKENHDAHPPCTGEPEDQSHDDGAAEPEMPVEPEQAENRGMPEEPGEAAADAAEPELIDRQPAADSSDASENAGEPDKPAEDADIPPQPAKAKARAPRTAKAVKDSAEPAKKGTATRKRAAATKKTEGDTEDEGQAPGEIEADTQADSQDEAEVEKSPSPIRPEPVKDVPKAPAPQPRPAPKAAARRVTAGSHGGPQVLDASGDAISGGNDGIDEDYYSLQSARNSRTILSSPVTAYEMSPGGSLLVVSSFGSFKIIIPVKEMGLKVNNATDNEYAMNMRYRRLIDSMLGATIDYVIKGVDLHSQLAAASRAEAIAYKRRTILNGTDRDGNYKIYEGVQCMARVLSVGDVFARLEIFGYELTLIKSEITKRWVDDIREILSPGDERKVVITQAVRNPETGEITRLRASMTGVEEIVDVAQNVKVGNVYMGEITNTYNNCYYVRCKELQIDVLCPAGLSYTPTMPRIGNTIKFVVREVSGSGKVVGAITRIQRKGGRGK